MKKTFNNNVVIYQTKSGALELRGDFSKETMWATQAQIAEVFNIERSVVTKHIRNILKDGELDKKAVCAFFAHTAEDGKTYQVQFYNLDIVLAVGYRTNSTKAINFRIWATEVLKKHLVDGYTINKARIVKNYESFLKVVEEVKLLLPEGGEVDVKTALELIKMFVDTWMSIDAYDTNIFPKSGASKKQVQFTPNLENSLYYPHIQLNRITLWKLQPRFALATLSRI